MVKLADTLTPRDSISPPKGVGENDAAIGESDLESLVASLWFWPVGPIANIWDYRLRLGIRVEVGFPKSPRPSLGQCYQSLPL